MRASKYSRRATTSLSLALVLVLASAVSAAAIAPDPPSPSGKWGQGVVLHPRWSDANPPPSWMQGPVLDAVSDSNATRASRAPFLSYSSSGEGTIAYTASGCGAALACANKTVSDYTWRIRLTEHGAVFNNPSLTVRWCDNPNYSGTNCWDVERVALHEFGHVLGLGHNPVDDTSMTIMYEKVHSNGGPGWQTHVFKSCDQARLQLQYDVPTTSSTYASCLSGLSNAGANGLKTTVTFATTATILCVGESATMSGTLKVQDLSGYGLLGGNALGSRSVVIQRAPHGQTNFIDYTTVTTASNGGWSRTVSTLASTDYDWRAKFASLSGLNGSTSASVRIRWLNAC
jgi:hypothetical protein